MALPRAGGSPLGLGVGRGALCPQIVVTAHKSGRVCRSLLSRSRSQSRLRWASALSASEHCRLCTLSLRLTDTVDGIRSLYTLSTENIFKTYNTLSTV